MSYFNYKKLRKDLQKIAHAITHWVGSVASLVVHTFVFSSFFLFYFAGMSISTILLILTTVVSLEAIYLAILIQMTVNKDEDLMENIETNLSKINKNMAEQHGDDCLKKEKK